MQRNWRKRFFPNPLQTFLVLVAGLCFCAAILTRVQGGPISPFLMMMVICLGMSWLIARDVRKPSEQNRVT